MSAWDSVKDYWRKIGERKEVPEEIWEWTRKQGESSDAQRESHQINTALQGNMKPKRK